MVRHLATLDRLFEGSPFLFREIPFLNIAQCRVPPSPPAIRDMKKPRQRKFAGASDSGACARVRDGAEHETGGVSLPVSYPLNIL